MNMITAGLIAVSFSFVGSTGLVQASGSHSHGHEELQSSKTMERMEESGHGHNDKGGHAGMAGGHQHDKWEAPPKEYASFVNKDWDDAEAGKQGKSLYAQQCAVCHGATGKGDGPAAAGLEHYPADLTNNFHTAPGEGDGYLFWRISEGGVVEPFSSMKSSMPAFKAVLSEQQRWDILTYIHQEFHGGFTKKTGKDNQSHSDISNDSHKGHGHGH